MNKQKRKKENENQLKNEPNENLDTHILNENQLKNETNEKVQKQEKREINEDWAKEPLWAKMQEKYPEVWAEYFEQEKQFDWLRNKGQLKLDFYLPQYNIAIECQGEQHFKPIDTWGGEENYKEVCFRDKLKLKQCNENNVTLLYFSHHKPKDKTIIHNLNELKKKIWLLTDKFYEGMQEDNNEKGKKF